MSEQPYVPTNPDGISAPSAHEGIRKAKVVAALASGMTVAEAADLVGLKTQTIRNWFKGDPDFNLMLEQAEERAVEAIIDEIPVQIRQRIKTLGEKALEVLTKSLESDDDRIRLQAANVVFRISGTMDKDTAQARAGVEAAMQAAPPADGD